MSILDKFTITEPKDEKSKAITDCFEGRKGVQLIHLQPGGWTYLEGYKKYADEYAKFEWYDDDVIVATMAKSGTTWMQEIVWTMRNNPSLDPAKMTQPLHIRSPNLEVDMTIAHVKQPKTMSDMFAKEFPDYDQSKGMFLHVSRMSPRPRTIKTHLPLPVLSTTLLDTAKVVSVIRDPRDVCLSYMHHSRIFMYDNFQGDLDQYIDAFIDGLVIFGPYWSHVKHHWDQRNHPNMFITFYEKLKKDPKSEYERLAKFLGLELTSDQVDKVIHFTSFNEMKNREHHLVSAEDNKDFINIALQQKDGGFFRQGTSGGWRKVFNQEQKDKFEAWIKKNCPDQEIMNNILNP